MNSNILSLSTAGGASDTPGALPVVHFENFKIVAGLWAERGVRKFMEDTHLLCPSLASVVSQSIKLPSYLDAAVFGIFDGHGGRQTAVFVRDNICQEIAALSIELSGDCTSITFDDVFVAKLLKGSFARIDSRIAQELPNCKDGCTVILLYLPLILQDSHQAFIACLGDAAAYLGRFHVDLQAIPLSEAHKPWAIKEKERILKAGGTVESGRVNGLLEVSRSLGDLPLKKLGVSCVPTLMKFSMEAAMQDSFILLGCDGFWINWTSIEAISKAHELITKEERRLTSLGLDPTVSFDPKLVCQQLVEHVLVEKKSQDNVSVILLRLQTMSNLK